MDKGPLVGQQIDAGMRFLEEFNKCYPVQFAFWLREEDDFLYLYIASEQITDENIDVAYGEAGRIGRANPDPWLDIFQVKVRGADNPLVKGVAEIYQRYLGRAPIHLYNQAFAGAQVEELYIYPSPIGRRQTARAPRKKTRPRHPSK
ncbi:MAG TPA: hypothetical protein VMG10_28590 [Gemmataceae bacterium]|nr:hypothetical protein [Gemmataceae bacterium]